MFSFLKNFKKVASDKDTTTLQHPKGHKIVIAHHQVDPKTKKELMSLPLHKDEGGAVSVPGSQIPNSDEAAAGAKPYAKSGPPDWNRAYGSGGGGNGRLTNEQKEIGDERTLAKGGRVHQSNPKLEESRKQPPINPNQMAAAWDPRAMMADGGDVDPAMVQKQLTDRDYNNNMNTGSGILDTLAAMAPDVGGAVAVPADQSQLMQNGQPGQNFNPAAYRQAQQQAGSEMKQNQNKAVQFNQDNDTRVQAGGQPQQMPSDLGQYSKEQVGAPPSPQPVSPNASPGPQQPTDYPGIWKQGFDEQLKGIQGQVAPEQQAQAASAAALSQANQAEKQMAQDQSDWRDHLMNDAYNVGQEIKKGDIKPEDLEPPGGNGFFGKIKNAIGMTLGAAASSNTGGPNLYYDWMNKQIDRHVDAQKYNNDRKSALMSHYSQMLGDNDRGAQMYSGIVHNAAADMVDAQSHRFQGAAAQAKAQQLSGQLRQQGAMNLSMATGGASGLPGSGSATPNGNFISMMAISNPEFAKSLRERYDPSTDAIAGVPLSSENRDNLLGHQQFQGAVQNAIDFANTHRGKIAGPDAAKAQAIQADLSAAYRQATHGGVYKAGEQEFIDNVIPKNLNSPLNQWSTIPKLQQVASDQGKNQQLLYSSLFGKNFKPGNNSPAKSGVPAPKSFKPSSK